MNFKKIDFTATKLLCFFHVFLLGISNVLVQYPFSILGFHSTWGAVFYPAIFILTDLTTRFFNVKIARKIIFYSMFPGLIISYFIASYIESTQAAQLHDFFSLHMVPLRIALASFIAYVIGQLLDINIFQNYSNKSSWWLAPTLSTIAGNIIDTILFFAIAFYHSTDPFLSQHWMEIAMVDIVFKITISLIAFIPIYGYLLNIIGINNVFFSQILKEKIDYSTKL